MGREQLIEWTDHVSDLAAGAVVSIDMGPDAGMIDFDVGDDIDYIKGSDDIAGRNEMFWAYQGTRTGNAVTPTSFVAVIANEAQGSDTQTSNLSGAGLTTSNGGLIIDGDKDYMERTEDGALSDPVMRDDRKPVFGTTDNEYLASGRACSNHTFVRTALRKPNSKNGQNLYASDVQELKRPRLAR